MDPLLQGFIVSLRKQCEPKCVEAADGTPGAWYWVQNGKRRLGVFFVPAELMREVEALLIRRTGASVEITDVQRPVVEGN